MTAVASCMSGWRAKVRMQLRYKYFVMRVIGQIHRQAQKGCFGVWTNMITNSKRSSNILYICHLRMVNNCLVKALNRWRDWKCHCFQFKVVLRKVVTQMKNSLLLSAIQAWIDNAKFLRKQKKLMHRALLRMKGFFIDHHIKLWRYNVQSLRFLRISILKIISKGSILSMRSVFSAWSDWCCWRKKVDLIAECILRRTKAKKRLVNIYSWRQTTLRSKQLNSKALRIVLRMSNLSAAMAIQTWALNALEMKTMRQELDKATRKVHCC